MPIKTDLSNYFDDYDESKNFHLTLFKPETAVQVRELIALQETFQTQIERMGNNLFKKGTIIEGVPFTFASHYPYAKVNDTTISGQTFVPGSVLGFYAKSETDLTAQIVDFADGFETTDPDLKTLYFRYDNSGDSMDETAFQPGQILTIYDGNNSIHSVDINAGGSGYSNSDFVVFTPVLLANVNSGTFAPGDTITDPITNASATVVLVSDVTQRVPDFVLGGTVATSTGPNLVGTSTSFTTNFVNGDYVAVYSNTSSYVLKRINAVVNGSFMNLTSNIAFTASGLTYANVVNSKVFVQYKPNPSDLTSNTTNATAWTFNSGNVLVGSTASDVLSIEGVLGSDADAVVTTDSSGKIIAITVDNRGTGYTETPYASVKSTTGSSANLTALNFHSQITVSTLADTVGYGYAFGVANGIVYQNGNFVKVYDQHILIDKYSPSPNNVVVGFITNETIVNANQDESLFDNVNGFDNVNAPGADRLKLTANLIVTSADANPLDQEFFALVQWSNGNPIIQNQDTAYNVIEEEAATTRAETFGNFVIDKFLTTTTDVFEDGIANSFNIVVDPGTAYVSGHKITTTGNYIITQPQAIDTIVQSNSKVSLDYGNYIRVNNLGGFFEFDRGNSIDLYDTAKSFLATSSLINAANTNPTGTKIGTARIRNFTFEQGTPGTPTATYRLYLFNVTMNPGKAFHDVKSVYYNGTIKGIADILLEPSGSNTANVAQLHNSNNNRMLFYVGVDSPLNSNNIDYIYRTIDETLSIANTGVLSISLSGSPGKHFPYSNVLSDAQKTEIYLSPQANLISQANLTGTVAVNSTSPNVTGTTTDFLNQLTVGQYINIIDGANNTVRRVASLVNATFLTVDSNVGFTSASANTKYAWPMNVPIQLAFNTNYSANVTGPDTTLNINLGSSLNTSSNTNVVVSYNVEVSNNAPTAKTPNRSVFVKLRLSNNAANTVGPWCLGVPDVFRMKNVYRGTSTVNTASSTLNDDFFIDTNQNANYYNLSYLFLRKNSTVVLTNDDYLLVEFDAFTSTPGMYNINSYVSSNAATRFATDAIPIEDQTTGVNTLEIPEVFGDDGSYYDLISSIDFRPIADATANVTSNLAIVTVNPSNTLTFSSTDRYFPVPDSIYKHDLEYFLPRYDSIILSEDKNISIITGKPGANTIPKIPAGSMRINNLFIPPYPSIATYLSAGAKDVLRTNVWNNKYNSTRITNRQIKTLFTGVDFAIEQPSAYNYSEIGEIDRRLKNVEYYVSFNLMQNVIKNKTIPSSISPNIDRFKYGFFVDDYLTTDFSETSSPEYNATVEGGFAEPPLIQFNMVHHGIHGTSPTPVPPPPNVPPPPPPPPNTVNTSTTYTNVELFYQGIATEIQLPPPPPPPKAPPPPPPPPVANTPSNTVITPTSYSGSLTLSPGWLQTRWFTETTTTVTQQPATKIVCTAMNEEYGFGSFRNAIWLKYGAGMAKEYEIGYHAIFLPLIDFAYKSPNRDAPLNRFVKGALERIAKRRTADLWKQNRGKMDLEGRIYRTILEPICYIVGSIIKKDD